MRERDRLMVNERRGGRPPWPPVGRIDYCATFAMQRSVRYPMNIVPDDDSAFARGGWKFVIAERLTVWNRSNRRGE
jgi:hypothetical protein